MSQVITDAFSNYWQQCLVDQTPVVLDEFVLAHIPGLDPDAPIDPASGLPPADQVVHRHAVDQRGRINNDAVAYSIVMDTTVGDFTFNAMYLINTGLNLVGMIVHKGEETKLATDPGSGQTGNSLVKSMLMEYDRAAEASQTVIDASTWQIDYAARLRGMDEDLRRQSMGTFGHAAFYGDGFKLVNDAGLYKVQPGQGYVGGLLVELASEQEVAPSAKPVGLWLDVYRAGSLLSPWVNHITLTLSTADLVDYVDANGYPHFVTRLATINVDDSVTDTRARRTLTLTGDVSGQASFNGPDSIELEVTIEDNSHAHTIENVTGLREALDGKAATGHTHTPEQAGAAPAEHVHAISDVSGLQETLDGKAASGHTHTPEQAGAAPAVHGHAIADVSGLQGALDGKATTGHTHTPEQAGAAPASHGHDPGSIGAAYASHTHPGAQGNADIVAGGYGQVGTYALLWGNMGATGIGYVSAGSALSWADAEGNHSGAPAGTWKQLGHRAVPATDNYGSMTTLWIRIS